MAEFSNLNGKPVLLAMVKAIQDNKAYLGEVDGLIGDGDHGMNMNKGFTLFGNRIADREVTFTAGLDELGTILFAEIGGSMGPIYGTIFCAMAEAGASHETFGTAEVASMLRSGLEELYTVVEARVGDKTLVDTLSPAVDSVEKAAQDGRPLAETLRSLQTAAAAGRDSTQDLVAKYGRSSRLGERSRGVLDAGAASCCLILTAMAAGILEQLEGSDHP